MSVFNVAQNLRLSNGVSAIPENATNLRFGTCKFTAEARDLIDRPSVEQPPPAGSQRTSAAGCRGPGMTAYAESLRTTDAASLSLLVRGYCT